VGRHKEPLEFPSPLGDVYVPLLVGGKTTGAFVARGTEASKQALVSASRLVGLAVERERFIEENAHMQAIKESEALKTSLLRAISHDLTTPLTTMTIAIETLRRHAENHEEMREPVIAIAEETRRLRRRIDNLLSMARLEAGKAKPRREPTPPADLFRAARENLPLVFQSRPVTIRVADDCPDANVDPSLSHSKVSRSISSAAAWCRASARSISRRRSTRCSSCLRRTPASRCSPITSSRASGTTRPVRRPTRSACT
jgi:K+-sensing histidine kinase KdpD